MDCFHCVTVLVFHAFSAGVVHTSGGLHAGLHVGLCVCICRSVLLQSLQSEDLLQLVHHIMAQAVDCPQKYSCNHTTNAHYDRTTR